MATNLSSDLIRQFFGILDDQVLRLALHDITVSILFQDIPQGLPGADITPAEIGSNYGSLRGLLHQCIINGITGTFRHGLIVETEKSPVPFAFSGSLGHTGKDLGGMFFHLLPEGLD